MGLLKAGEYQQIFVNFETYLLLQKLGKLAKFW